MNNNLILFAKIMFLISILLGLPSILMATECTNPCMHWDDGACDRQKDNGTSTGDCTECQSGAEEDKAEDTDCGTCGTCQSGSCLDTDSRCSGNSDGYKCISDACGCSTYSDCPNFNNCNGGTCGDCRHWFDGDPIINSTLDDLLTASDSTPDLCETITISAGDFEDNDVYYLGSATVSTSSSDTLKYNSWDSGDGEWDGSDPIDTSDTASWRSAETGSQTISVSINDTPDSMDDVCVEVFDPASERDDAAKPASVSVTVGLPSGCSAGTKSATLNSTKTSTPTCSGSCGAMTADLDDVASTIVAKYNNGKWEFQVTASLDVATRPCTGYFTEIDDGEDSDVTSSNYCDLAEGFQSLSRCFSVDGSGPIYGHEDCTQLHEDKHYDIFSTYLTGTATTFLLNISYMEISIDCDISNTTTCGGVESIYSNTIEIATELAYANAADDTGSAASELLCEAAAASCYSDIGASICDEWDPSGECEWCD